MEVKIEALDRTKFLQAANHVVTNYGEKQYGKAENNLSYIAELWSVYVNNAFFKDGNLISGLEFSERDVALMMCLLKIARMGNEGGTADCYTDLCGYGALAGEMFKKYEKENISDPSVAVP